MKKLIALLTLVLVLISSVSAFAWGAEKVEWDEVKLEIDEEFKKPSQWAEPEIKSAEENDLIPALTGSPIYKEAITREQFAELAVRLIEKSTGEKLNAGDAVFTDCENSEVLKAFGAGVVTGIGEGRFDPKTVTNREQIATMLCRAIKYIEQKNNISILTNTKDISYFADSAEISAWAKEGIELLVANGLMNGTSETTVSPLQECTVEQSIAFVVRIYNMTKNV